MSQVDDRLAADAAQWRAAVDPHVRRFRIDSRYREKRRARTAIISGAAIAACAAATAGFVAIADAGTGGNSQLGTSCAAPTLTASAATVSAGQRITLTGTNFIAACQDVEEPGQPLKATPYETVALRLRPAAGPQVALATVHPDPSGSFAIAVTVPPTTKSGSAQS